MTLRRLLTATGTQLGTAVGSLIAIVTLDQAAWLRIALIALISGFAFAVIAFDVIVFFSEGNRGYKKQSHINRFMYRWISEPGRVAIFSRDMSWVSADVHARWYERFLRWARRIDPPSTRELLLKKARADELTLCLPAETNLSRELQHAGAELATYDALGVVPGARFTIVRWGRPDAEVAIGRRDGAIHRIERFANGRHPAFAMAEDLVHIVIGYSQTK